MLGTVSMLGRTNIKLQCGCLFKGCGHPFFPRPNLCVPAQLYIWFIDCKCHRFGNALFGSLLLLLLLVFLFIILMVNDR